MNKFLLVVFLLLTSSCSVIPKKNYTKKNDVKKVTIYANIDSPSQNLFNRPVKTKITILKDSITLSFAPIFAIEMGKIIIKDNVVSLSQNLKNTIDTIIGLKPSSPKFKVKHIQNKMIQRKFKKDTMVYKNDLAKLVFTDYILSNNIYLPEKILFLNNTVSEEKNTHVVNLKYKSVIHR